MRGGVCRVGKLARQKRALFFGNFPGRLNGARHALCAGGKHQLGPIGQHQGAALGAHGIGHHNLRPVAAHGARHAQAHAGVAAGGLHHGVARVQAAGALGLVQRRNGHAVFGAAAGVAALQLYQKARGQALALFQIMQAHKRGVAHKLRRAIVNVFHAPALRCVFRPFSGFEIYFSSYRLCAPRASFFCPNGRAARKKSRPLGGAACRGA